MPVRIYDIAKKLGIESKEVLVKAKELGITGARVPSSSLDKITAAYLEEQLGGVPKLPPPSSPPPAEDKIVLVTKPEATATAAATAPPLDVLSETYAPVAIAS